MRLITSILFITYFILPITIEAQNNRFNNWYFGNKAGIDFNTTPPTILTNSSMNTHEGAASISDKNGNLLFYSDGVTIWNKSHNPMLNATGLKGHSSATQSCLITPYPGSEKKYYIFTSDEMANYDGLHYSIIDMRLDSDMGGIDSFKNIMLTDSVSEKICANIHANGYDYWIVTRKTSSSTFHSYLASCDGISSTPVISDAGNFYSDKGYMKSSKDGKMIISAELTNNGVVQSFDFDNATGVVTFNSVISQSTSKYYYGVEFSPDDAIIYVSNDTIICQYQRYAINIGTSETILNHSGASSCAMQLAPDNKIYIGIRHQDTISVINDPDNLSNPDISIASVCLGGGNARESITSFFYPFPVHKKNFEYTLEDTIICPENSFKMNASLPDTFSYQWNPVHIFNNHLISEPDVTIDETTSAYITITDAYGCRKADTVNITTDIELCPVTSIFIPNAFSPNNDGINEEFIIRGAELKDFNLNIYNRWGTMVFSSTDQSQGWKGVIDGKYASKDVYMWELTYKDTNDQEYRRNGNLSLIK